VSRPVPDWVAFVGALVGGFFVGAVATVYHAAWFPWGLVAATAVVSLLVVSLRVVGETRALAIAGSVGYVGVITVLAGVDSQGSVLVVADTAGMVFLAVVTFVTVIALAWPRISPRATRYDRDSGLAERTPPQ
jgi:hypothetical protein